MVKWEVGDNCKITRKYKICLNALSLNFAIYPLQFTLQLSNFQSPPLPFPHVDKRLPGIQRGGILKCDRSGSYFGIRVRIMKRRVRMVVSSKSSSTLVLDRRSIDLSGAQEKESHFHYKTFLRASK